MPPPGEPGAVPPPPPTPGQQYPPTQQMPPQYPPAQQYYDSTSALLAETHKRYEEVKIRAEVLTELVEQLDIIAREDSLQAFAKLDPEEREKRVRKLIKERERAEEEKACLLYTSPSPRD